MTNNLRAIRENPTKRRSPTLMKNQQEIATPALCNIADSEIDREKSCKNAQKKTLPPTRRLTYMAAMTAISLLLKLVSNALSVLMPPTMKISLSYLGWSRRSRRTAWRRNSRRADRYSRSVRVRHRSQSPAYRRKLPRNRSVRTLTPLPARKERNAPRHNRGYGFASRGHAGA